MGESEPEAPALRGADRRHLRRLAHDLDPLVRIGSAGLTRGVVEALDDALAIHELVKVKLAGEREERRRTASELAESTGSELAGLVGATAIYFRRAAAPEDRRIALPSDEPAA